MNGCMSDVFRSSFSYQVAVGSTMSPYRQVVLIRKSRIVTRSSLPSSGICSGVRTSVGRTVSLASQNTEFCVPSRYFRKYSCPLPLEPRMFERQTNRLRGKFFGFSGSSQLMRCEPSFRPRTRYFTGSSPAFSAASTISSGLFSSCGADGSQPMRSARALKSISASGSIAFLSAVGARISPTRSCSCRYWPVCA